MFIAPFKALHILKQTKNQLKMLGLKLTLWCICIKCLFNVPIVAIFFCFGTIKVKMFQSLDIFAPVFVIPEISYASPRCSTTRDDKYLIFVRVADRKCVLAFKFHAVFFVIKPF